MALALAFTVLLSLLVAPAAQAAGTLSGTLRGPDGEPFDYFKIEAYSANPGGGWRVVKATTITPWDSGLPVGGFSMSLPAGSYRVCFTPEGFEYAETAGATCWRAAHEVHEATDLAIGEATATTIAPRLPREGRLMGRVAGPGNVPVEAYVAPYLRAPDGTWTLQRTGGMSTGGTIDLQELNPGRYRFCVSEVPREFIPECWRNAASVASATDVNIGSGGSPSIVINLAGRASISGTVTKPAGLDAGSMQLYEFGEPWPGAEPRWQFVAYGAINAADGTYRITGLDPGTYRACAYSYDTVSACWRTGSQPSDGDDIVLAAGQARRGIDLTPQRAGYVAGVLPDMYLGAQGVPLVSALRETDAGWVALSTAEAVPTGPGTQWSYELGSLSAGPVVICVEHQDPEFVPAFPVTCAGDSPSPRGGEPIDVTAGQTTTAPPLPTGQAGEIRGRVVDPPRPIQVELFTRSGRVAATVLTSANGSYRFAALPGGDYRVGFHRNSVRSPLAAEYWRDRQDGSGLAAATPIRVGGSVITGISATLNQGGTLTGRLVDADGQPVAQCRVYARGRDNSLGWRWAVTDAGGAFAIGGLSTAAYVASLSPSCSGNGRWMYYDAQSPTRTSARLSMDADTIAVTRGGSTALPGDLVTGTPEITQIRPPSLTGPLKVGTALTATGGTWNPEVVWRTYRWYADGARIAGVVGRRLVPTPDLAGKRIRVYEDVTAFGWDEASGRSPYVGPVAP